MISRLWYAVDTLDERLFWNLMADARTLKVEADHKIIVDVGRQADGRENGGSTLSN